MTLLTPLTIRGVTLKHRIVVSPMCQYSSVDGFANDWHLVHLGSRAVGGAALIFVEATAVTADGRITPADMGLWDDRHIEPLARIAKFIQDHNAVPAIQLAHAGRKASCDVPWAGGKQLGLKQGGWQTIAPSPIPFNETDRPPRELSESEICAIVEAFAAAARRAVEGRFPHHRTAQRTRLSAARIFVTVVESPHGSLWRESHAARFGGGPGAAPRDAGEHAAVRSHFLHRLG